MPAQAGRRASGLVLAIGSHPEHQVAEHDRVSGRRPPGAPRSGCRPFRRSRGPGADGWLSALDRSSLRGRGSSAFPRDRLSSDQLYDRRSLCLAAAGLRRHGGRGRHRPGPEPGRALPRRYDQLRSCRVHRPTRGVPGSSVVPATATSTAGAAAMADSPRAPERPSIWAVLLLVASLACLAVLVVMVWVGI